MKTFLLKYRQYLHILWITLAILVNFFKDLQQFKNFPFED